MAGECRKKKIRNDCGATSVGDGVVRFTYGVGEGAACGEEIGSISMDQCENETINIPCPTNSVLEIKHCDETYIYDPSDVEDTVIDLGCGRLIDWSNMPVCDDCIVWCGETGPGSGQFPALSEKPAFIDLALQQGAVKRKSEPKGFKSKPAAKLPPKPPAKPPQKQGKPDRVYVLKFWSTSCGICGRMAHYDQKVSEEEGATYISVQKLKPDVWARYLYVAKQKFEDPNTQMGFPTYMVCKGPGDLSLEVVDVINGGMDKGKFRAKVKAGIAKAKESFQSEAGTTDSPEPTPVPAKKKTKVFKFSSSDCGTCGRMAKFDQGAVEQLGYEFQTVNRGDTEEWEKYQYVLDQIYGPEDVIGFPSYIAVEGTDETDMVALGEVRGGMDKGKFKEKIQLVIKNRASEPRIEPGDDNCKYWKVRCQCGCQQDEGESGGNPTWTTKYYEDENLPGSNSDYEVISTHEDQNICQDNKCIKLELGCNCNFGAVNGGDIRDGLCTLTCYKKKDEPEPTPEPEPTCDKDFTLVLDCPKDCGKESGTRTISANADGIANSNVTFKWYEGSAGGGNQIGSGTSVNINCPPPGQSQKYACQATYKEGPCDITRTENCVVSTDADPCAGVSCGPCQECVNGECVDQCKPGEECVNGNCQPVDPCKDVTCAPCHNCVNGECVDQCGPDQECVGGKCQDKDPCKDVSCPPCHRCVNGECVDQCGPDQECVNGKCEGIDPCEGVSCPPCNECIGGECVDQCRPNQECVGGNCVDKDPCDGVSCPPCHECVNGECVSLCKPGEKCEGGNCVPGDPCEGVSCPPCHECVNGECVSLCKPGEICDGGTCVPGDPCEGVSCPPCHECVNGECVFTCADGEKCENGQCVPGDPCEGVSCPPCHECVNGECVSLCGPGEKCENGQCVPGDPCEGVSCPPAITALTGSVSRSAALEKIALTGSASTRIPASALLALLVMTASMGNA